MSQLTERVALAVFTVLTGALATNMFVLQPPARHTVTGPEDRLTALRQDGTATGSIHTPPDQPKDASPAKAPTTEAPASTQASSPATTAASQAPPSTSEPSLAVAPSQENPLKVTPPASTVNPELVKAIQRELRARSYETGGEDGTVTLVTRAAIMAYEADQNLPLTGEPREDLLKHIILGDAGGSPAAPAKTDELPASAQEVVRSAQAELKRAGFDPGAEDGRLSEATIRAIRSFEETEHLPQKGRISGELLAKLKTAPAKQASK